MKNQINLLFIAAFLAQGCTTTDSDLIREEILSIENGLQKPILIKGDSINTFSIHERMKHHNVPGISIAVVKDGEIRWSKGYGLANTIDSSKVSTTTLFQAGSISKPIAALAALKLVEEGKVELDTDVNRYLKNWKIEENRFTTGSKVTLRRLLTHTAGTTVYGFPGYNQTDTLPSLEEILDGKGNTPKVYVEAVPGSRWSYSGGGYTIMERVVEDVSGTSLDEFMDDHLFEPLGMTNTTFKQLSPENYLRKASVAFDLEGNMIEGYWHNYPEQAAAGLWTTAEDLAKYCIEIQQILGGKNNSVLKKETIEVMLTRHSNDWGLGPSLVWNGDSLRFQHNGKTAGFATDMIAFAYQGNAVVVLTNGDGGRLLIDEILRSVSNRYGWNIIGSKEVEIAKLKPTQLKKMVGKYSFDPTSTEHLFEITSNGQKLILDAGERGTFEFFALANSKFMDLETGNELAFDISNDQVQLTWNGEDKFYKIE